MATALNVNAAWRSIRRLRHAPPGLARTSPDRALTFNSALEQAQQFFEAAAVVGPETRPVLEFYGLSQAGRAISAVAHGGKTEWSFSGHGIFPENLDTRPSLSKLSVRDNRKGGFIRVARCLRSPTLPNGATLGQLWPMIPEGAQLPIPGIDPAYNALAIFPGEHGGDSAFLTMTDKTTGWLVGLPELAVRSRVVDDLKAATAANYPHLGVFGGLNGQPNFRPSYDPDWRYGAFIEWNVKSAGSAGQRVTELLERGRQYPNQIEMTHSWIFPSAPGSDVPLHPLISWWAVLFALSMLARYEPQQWESMLNVAESAECVPIEHLLDEGLLTIPNLILGAINEAARP